MRLYIHGFGRVGAAAWPGASKTDAVFADLTAAAGMSAEIEAVADLYSSGPATVIAHSAGAVPAVLALRSSAAANVERLVLVEPALYDIARGDDAIERHIRTMTAARSRADDGDLWGFWSIVRPMMFGLADPAEWEAERPRAEWLAAIELPWGHGASADMIAAVPTLVVSGGWNDEYEAIAKRLVEAGARHRVLAGFGHRPDDHPEFAGIVDDFVAEPRGGD